MRLAHAVLVAAAVVAAAPVAIQPGPQADTEPDQIVAVMIGDSYTAGAGASSAATRWSTLAAQRLGWIEVNMAYGGTGYLHAVPSPTSTTACARDYCPSYAELLDEVAAVGPDVVVVNGGRNEAGVVDSAWHAGVAQFFVDLRAALPTAGIVATSPIWDDDPPPAALDAMRATIRTAVQSVGGSYVDLRDPLLGQPALVAADGVHPNDDGHRAIADAFLGASTVRTRPAPTDVQFPGVPGRTRP